MSIQTVNLVKQMVERFSQLSVFLDEHMEDNFGEILPHVFFGDLTRYIVSLYIVQQADDQERNKQVLPSILDYLENAFQHGSEEIQELISVSFLEHLPRPGNEGSGIRDMIGPSMSKQLQVIG